MHYPKAYAFGGVRRWVSDRSHIQRETSGKKQKEILLPILNQRKSVYAPRGKRVSQPNGSRLN
jgi:hypothetical protein